MASPLAQRARWRTAARLAGVALPIVLCVLAACSSAPSKSSTGRANTTSGPPSKVGVGTPTAVPVYGPFQADFTEQYALITCDARQPKGTLCLSMSGTGTGTTDGRSLGGVGLQRSSIYATGDASTCSPATTQGTLTLPNGDTITFMGTGTFCRAFQSATFTYTITGGTGHYQRASGTGTINVPPPNSASAGTESWGGTLLTGS